MRDSGMTAGRPGGGRWARLWAWAVSGALLAPGAAWAAAFKKAPGSGQDGGGSSGPDTILGLIHVNTAFFIAVGVIAFFWFVFGGGRRAKLRGKDH